jgi:hypothetical protein
MNGMEFRIEITPGKLSYTYGERNGETIEELPEELDFDIDNLHLETAQLLESWLNVWDRIGQTENLQALLDSDPFKIIGKHLWLLLLDNAVGGALQAKMAEPQVTPLQVQISFARYTAPELRRLPWEFLCEPLTENFLVTATNLLLVRYASLTDFPGTRVDRAADKLRVQFITALPLAAKYKAVNTRVQKLEADLSAEAGLDPHALIEDLDVDKIKAALHKDAPPCHVVHINGLCRGEPGKPKLWMSSDSGKPDWLDATPLTEALTAIENRLPRLVILQLTETEAGDADENFERLAPALIRSGIPAVLAMQYTLPPDDKNEIWIQFYKDLAAKKSVGEAVQAFRQALMKGSRATREMGSPVLYLREDGPLIEQGDDSAKSSTETRGGRRNLQRGGGVDIQLALKPTLIDAADLYSPRTVRQTQRWLSETVFDGTVVDARAKLRAYLKRHEGEPEIVELCKEIGRALNQLEKSDSHA